MSKMIKCKTCSADIAKSAKSCPACGAKNKSPFYKRWWFILIVVIVIIGAIGGGSSSNNNEELASSSSNETTSNETTSKESVKSESKEDNKVNYENFLNIQMGMSYDQAKEILGDGEELSSSEISGIKTSMYSWNGKGISTLTVTVQNDAITNKAQAGLKSMDAQITMDKYNKIENGMTYDQVKEILGEGQLASESKIMDITSTMYSYINKDGSNANFTFDSSGVSAKAQFNLK